VELSSGVSIAEMSDIESKSAMSRPKSKALLLLLATILLALTTALNGLPPMFFDSGGYLNHS
jgi:hypothetical protein